MKLQGSVLVFHTEQLRFVFHGHADRLEGRQPRLHHKRELHGLRKHFARGSEWRRNRFPSGTRTPASKIVFRFLVATVLRECVPSFQGSGSVLGELGDSADLVPIRNEDVSIGIDETAMGCAEDACFDVVRIEFVPRPLRFQGIVA